MSAVAQREQTLDTEGTVDASYGEMFGEPLPYLNTVGGTAFAHRDDTNCYILVQDRNVPFRKNVIEGYNRIKASCLSDLRDFKVTQTPVGTAASYVMQRPGGGKVFNGVPVGDKLLRTVLIPDIINCFKTLHDEGLSYRYLSPERVYYRTDQQDQVMLLECFSVPPGLEMPFSYESIPNGMVEPTARGEGGPHEDYYALGVFITHMITGRDPIGGRSEQSYQQARMNQGSYAACLSGSNITGAVSALLRGLLQDDVEQRWGYRDVMNWLNGELRRAAPSGSQWTLPQPVSVAGRTMTDRRALAAAMQAQPDAAESMLKRKNTTQWVAQIAPGSDAHQAIVNLLEYGNTTKRVDASGNGKDAILARYCSLLDPMGPIRFRSLTLMPDGVGPYYAANFLQGNKERLSDLRTLMTGNVWHGLMELRALMTTDESQVDQMTSRVSWLKDAQHVADGLERAFYALNEGLPCHSNQLGDAFALTPVQVLKALDKRSSGTADGIKLDDKDLLAFLAARAPFIRRYIFSLSSIRPDSRDGVLLKLYGELHLQFGSPPLIGLCQLFHKRFKGHMTKLKSKTRRDLLVKKVEAAAEEGELSTLAKLLNMERLSGADSRGFAQARAKLKKLDRAMKFASRTISATDPTAVSKSAQVGCYLGGFTLLGSIIMRLF